MTIKEVEKAKVSVCLGRRIPKMMEKKERCRRR